VAGSNQSFAVLKVTSAAPTWKRLTNLENAGFPLITTVSDTGPKNLKLWKEYRNCYQYNFI
jgi:hypothetical protein